MCHNQLHLYSLHDFTFDTLNVRLKKETYNWQKHLLQRDPPAMHSAYCVHCIHDIVWTFYLMSSSVTTNALQRGCAVLSQTPGFFSTAAVSCPVTGAGLVCRALAMAESSVLSEHTGPTPKQRTTGGHKSSLKNNIPALNHTRLSYLLWLSSPCKPLGRSIVFTSSSAMSKAFNPLSFLSQNSWRSSKQKNKVLSTFFLKLNMSIII